VAQLVKKRLAATIMRVEADRKLFIKAPPPRNGRLYRPSVATW